MAKLVHGLGTTFSQSLLARCACAIRAQKGLDTILCLLMLIAAQGVQAMGRGRGVGGDQDMRKSMGICNHRDKS